MRKPILVATAIAAIGYVAFRIIRKPKDKKLMQVAQESGGVLVGIYKAAKTIEGALDGVRK